MCKLKKKKINLRQRLDFWSKSVVFFYSLVKPLKTCWSGVNNKFNDIGTNRYTRERARLYKKKKIITKGFRCIKRGALGSYSYFFFLKRKKLKVSALRLTYTGGYKTKINTIKTKINTIKNYSFFFLSLSRKRSRRSKHSRSASKRFFTNIYLVAFIFIRPAKFKKIWYTKLITKRVLNFFCTNF